MPGSLYQRIQSMRDGRGILGTCLGNVTHSGGGDLDKLLCGLKKRTQKGSPCLADAPSRRDQPAVDADGKSQDEAISWERKSNLSQADLLRSGNKGLPYLSEPMGKNPALATALSKDEGLSCASAKEHLAGVSSGIGESLNRATDHHEGQCPEGEPWVSGWPGHPKPCDMGFFKGEPPSAFPDKPGAHLELSCLHPELSQMLNGLSEVLKDETGCAFLDLLKPMFSEQTVGCKKLASSIKSTSNGLQIILGSLAPPPLKVADLSCRS